MHTFSPSLRDTTRTPFRVSSGTRARSSTTSRSVFDNDSFTDRRSQRFVESPRGQDPAFRDCLSFALSAANRLLRFPSPSVPLFTIARTVSTGVPGHSAHPRDEGNDVDDAGNHRHRHRRFASGEARIRIVAAPRSVLASLVDTLLVSRVASVDADVAVNEWNRELDGDVGVAAPPRPARRIGIEIRYHSGGDHRAPMTHAERVRTHTLRSSEYVCSCRAARERELWEKEQQREESNLE